MFPFVVRGAITQGTGVTCSFPLAVSGENRAGIGFHQRTVRLRHTQNQRLPMIPEQNLSFPSRIARVDGLTSTATWASSAG